MLDRPPLDGLSSKKRWLWALCTPQLEVFHIAKNRTRAAARKLVGGNFVGTLVTDRYSAYAKLSSKRQLCHAHLYRDWLKVQQRGGADEEIGRELRRLTRKLLRAHRRMRREGLDQTWLQHELRPIERSYARWLVRGYERGSKQTQTLCGRLHASRAQLWTFCADERVDPTNNRAERAVRHPVTLRKNSYGNDSARGCRFIERMLTLRGSLRRQALLLPFVRDCLAAARGALQLPSLLPAVT